MKTRLFSTLSWLIISLFLSQTGNGQIRSIEPSPAEKTSPETVQQLIDNASMLKQQQQGDSSLLVYLEALRQSASIAYQEGIDTTIYHLSHDLEPLGFDPFYGEITNQAIQYAGNDPKDKVSLARLLKSYGFYLFLQDSYYPAMQVYQKALKIVPEASADGQKVQGRIFQGISVLCMELKQFDQARKWLGDWERLAQPARDTPSLILINTIKGLINRQTFEPDSAYYYLNIAYQMGEAFQEKNMPPSTRLSSTAGSLSMILIDRHEAGRAMILLNRELANLQKVIASKRAQGYLHYYPEESLSSLAFTKAYAAYELRDYAQAETEALQLLERGQKEKREGSIYQLLAAIYAAQNRFDAAYYYQEKFILLVQKTTETAETRALKEQYEAQKNQALAQKELLIEQQQSRLREQKIWIGGSALGILLLGIAIIFIYRSNRNKQKLQSASILNLQQEQKISQLQAKVEGEEQERSRIARELHDGIVSQLMALKLNINALQNNGKPVIFHNELNDAALQLEEATQDLRKTAHNLMPDLLLQQGLALSVAALCEKISRNTPLDVAFQAYGKLPKLQQETELTLYRMIQELIQNAQKHAEATQLLVQLSCRENSLNITVEDNGKGFPVARLEQDNREGVGLNNIKRRAEILKGQVDIRSRHDIGTMVYLEFELKNLV